MPGRAPSRPRNAVRRGGTGAAPDEEALLPRRFARQEAEVVVADHPAPGRQVVFDRGLDAAHLQHAALGHPEHVLADEQHETAAAVEVAAVEDVMQRRVQGEKRRYATAREIQRRIDEGRLDKAAAPHEIHWEWVRGHSGHPENEMADALANRAIDELLRK